MRKLVIVTTLLLLISAACGSDDRSANSPDITPSPAVASATPTVSPAETVTPTPSPDPTLPPIPTQPPLIATPSCVTPAEPTHARVRDWPDPTGFQAAIIAALPWDVPGIPDDVPMDPEFWLSDSMDAPTDITGNEPVTFTLVAQNHYDETIAFEMSGDPGYDFVVFSVSGEVVWLYSDHIDVELGQNFLELEPDESRDLSATWDLTGPDGEQVDDGVYFVLGILFREEPQIETVEQFLYIGERPSLEESLDVRLSAPSEVKCGEAVPMTLEVTNTTGSLLRIFTGADFDNYFAFAPGAEDEGEEIWSWWPANGTFVPDVGVGGWFMPGETATFTRSWELQDFSGSHVPPGVYRLQASFYASQVHGITGPDGAYETLWSNIVEITVSG